MILRSEFAGYLYRFSVVLFSTIFSYKVQQ